MHDEDLLAAHVAVQTNLDLSVVETVHHGVLEIDAEVAADRLGQLTISAARKNPIMRERNEGNRSSLLWYCCVSPL